MVKFSIIKQKRTITKTKIKKKAKTWKIQRNTQNAKLIYKSKSLELKFFKWVVNNKNLLF